MPASSYLPAFELTRGKTVESIHHAAIVVVAANGELLAWYGLPDAVTFLRSSAKPFQVLPFVEGGGLQAFGLTQRELAVMCASHSGTDEHVKVVRGIQKKAGISESELLCGIHTPGDEATVLAMRQRNEEPTAVRHNCSGKHTGMLAFTRFSGTASANLDYIDPRHPIQQTILKTFAEMCDLPVEQVALGADGCSAPNFAVPLRNAALAFARLADPTAGAVRPVSEYSRTRIAACREIFSAMTSHPDMVGGPGRFDTRLMQAGRGLIVSKGGAEGYQGIGLLPGSLGPGSPAVGIALKIADGDARGKARPAVALEVLRQLGALSPDQLAELADMGPSLPVTNWRKILVGQAYPTFHLNWTTQPVQENLHALA